MSNTKISTARLRDGRPYEGHTCYLGNGMTRSCGRCGRHRPMLGGTKHRQLGWVCIDCSKSEKAMP